MRTLLVATAILMSSTAVQAQTAPTLAPVATPAAHYSAEATDIGSLLDDPAARAVLDKHIPGMTTNPQIDMARAMTLKMVQQYSPSTITDKVLVDVDADFAKLPVKAPAK